MRRVFVGASPIVFFGTFTWLTGLALAAIVLPGGTGNGALRLGASATVIIISTAQLVASTQFKQALHARHPDVVRRRGIGSSLFGDNWWRVLGATQDRAVLADSGLSTAARTLAALVIATLVWIASVWLAAASWMAVGALSDGSPVGLVFGLIITGCFVFLFRPAYIAFRGPRHEDEPAAV